MSIEVKLAMMYIVFSFMVVGKMQKILISGCLLGAKVRYNGEDKLIG